MADHAVTLLLEKVTEMIKVHADLIFGADREFKHLEQDLQQLQAILKDIANASGDDQDGRSNKNKIREVVYEVEDAIDSWLTESKSKGRIVRGVTHFSIAKRVKSLREDKVKKMLVMANARKRDLESRGTAKEAEFEERRRTADQPIRQLKVVGVRDEEEIIKGYLMKDQPKLDIVPVIGMPGLGKTTLARKIYNDQRIRYEFPIRIWVHFSQRFNVRDVLIQIMENFTSPVDELHSMTNRELCNKVHACLRREKFLLVVDDVWKTEHWDAVKDALPYENGNGKVMITSREMTVGRHVQQITEPFMQRPLSSHESWELLQLEVFGEVGSCPDLLQGVGSYIAERCEGIPLIIVVMGGVLKDQYLRLKSVALVKEKWNEVAENRNRALEDKKKVILDVVASSYERLPERLKDCFLYLGVFPAGYKIQTWTLMRLWIAEGFVQPDGERSLEKIAEENLNDLIDRNLLMVHRTNPMGEVKECNVHDIIRLFCTAEASIQKFSQEIRMMDEEYDGTALESKMKEVHRLCVHSDLQKFFSMDIEGPRVRSFLCFKNNVMDLDLRYNSVIPDKFALLRILHSQSIRLKKIPPKLIKLIHLRYIVLCVSDLTALPEQISQLWNLQTIVVDTNSNSISMRANIWKMMQLRHVKTKASIILNKTQVKGEAGKNLQTLNRLSPESVTAAFSQKASNLNTLGIRGDLAPLFDDMSLEKLNHLEKLKLYHVVESETQLRRFPGCDRFPPNLRRLTLSNTFLNWKHMSTLANIAGLEALKLKNNAFTGIHWDASNYVFTRLKFLLIVNSDLVLWVAAPNTFPCITHLVLKNCEKLKGIPDSMLQQLDNLEIERVRKSVAESVRNCDVRVTIGSLLDIA